MKTSKTKKHAAKKGPVDWTDVKEKQLEGVLARAKHKTETYLISVENRKEPLNYEIYPIKDGKVVLNEYQRSYMDYDCGLSHAIEVAEIIKNKLK